MAQQGGRRSPGATRRYEDICASESEGDGFSDDDLRFEHICDGDKDGGAAMAVAAATTLATTPKRVTVRERLAALLRRRVGAGGRRRNTVGAPVAGAAAVAAEYYDSTISGSRSLPIPTDDDDAVRRPATHSAGGEQDKDLEDMAASSSDEWDSDEPRLPDLLGDLPDAALPPEARQAKKPPPAAPSGSSRNSSFQIKVTPPRAAGDGAGESHRGAVITFAIGRGSVEALFVTSTEAAAEMVSGQPKEADVDATSIAEVVAPFPVLAARGAPPQCPLLHGPVAGAAAAAAAGHRAGPVASSASGSVSEKPLREGARPASEVAAAVAHVVCSGGSVAGRPSVPLRDVFDSPEWAALVDARCPPGLALVATSFGELKTLDGLRLLSYRWSEIVDTTCGVKLPGEKEYRAVKRRQLAVDALRVFGREGPHFAGYLWVDFLCHLDDPESKRHVLQSMGSLYSEGIVLPLYLADYTDAADAALDTDLGKGKGSTQPADMVADRLAASLRRGWIQQEIGYGRLDRGEVSRFVVACVAAGDFGLLGTLLRRRARAMSWALMRDGLASMDLRISDLGADDDPAEGVAGPTAKPSRGSSARVARAVAAMIAQAFFEANPGAAESEIPAVGQESPESRVAREGRARDEFFRKNLVHVSQNLGPFLDDFVDELVAPQPFVASDVFSAVRLIRSVVESSLTFEEDAVVATTQCAAFHAGLPWVARPNPDAELFENTAVLRQCWATIVSRVADGAVGDVPYHFRMRRSDARLWSAGLGHVPGLAEMVRASKAGGPPL